MQFTVENDELCKHTNEVTYDIGIGCCEYADSLHYAYMSHPDDGFLAYPSSMHEDIQRSLCVEHSWVIVQGSK